MRRLLPTLLCLMSITITVSDTLPSGQIATHAAIPKADSVGCRVMESFTDKRLGVTAVLFHQRNKDEGPRLGELLSSHSGETMEIETADGRRHSVTVFRVRSCFGRGVFMLPNDFRLQAKDEFVLRLIPKP